MRIRTHTERENKINDLWLHYKSRWRACQRAKDIRDAVEELSKDEYEKVGPALGKFYSKLTRFNSSDVINIVQENEGISLVDDKGKNIVNVLSNGQISVFMLAHFFAGINARNDREKRVTVYE